MRVSRRFYILLSVVIVSLGAIILLLLLGGKRPETVDSPSSVAAVQYTIGEWEGQVAVFLPGQQRPDQLFDVFVSTLPEEEQNKLREGIPVYSDAQLQALLEDYTS